MAADARAYYELVQEAARVREELRGLKEQKSGGGAAASSGGETSV